jgi:pyruvate,water dikinase
VDTVDVSQLPRPHTKIMMNIGSPELAFKQSAIPNDGVGLARMEFIFANWVQVHPLALTRYATCRQRPSAGRCGDDGYADKIEFFVDKLAQGIGYHRCRLLPQAGDPAPLRLQDQRVCPPGRRSAL